QDGNPVTAPVPAQRHQIANHLGSSSVELNENGALIAYEEYHPYGTTSFQAGRGAAEVSLKRYRYAGRERDEETGFSYHDARYCAPWLARWTSCDPLGIPPPGGTDRQPPKRGAADVATSLNLYLYVADHPTSLVDPDGREPRSAAVMELVERAQQTTEAGTSAAAAAVGGFKASGLKSKSSSGKGGPGFFESIVAGLHAAGKWMREWLPGLIAAPLAGLVDVLAGAIRSIGGIFSGSGAKTLEGLKDMGLGLLSMTGFKEIAAEKWDTPIGTSGNFKGPKTLAGDIQKAEKVMEKMAPFGSSKDPAKNGMHAWHAATNAALANRMGPVGAPFLWLGGLIHETPLDELSFQAEQNAQGTVNHILDSTMDIVANTVGMLLGFLLPRKLAVRAAVFLGNHIPGPHDLDPTGTGAGGYTGNPVDAWGQYPH
ncbi:RHS repeat domain-containing protein, partial [Streptomyces sp. NPDC059786]|uniref:RHS repeat domain-containing protein n=1 Tax=Streptomyces sp. NPDC059786 TaxID=3346946 RepID=UPI00364646BD